MTVESPPDNAGVTMPPPLLFIGTALAALALHFLIRDPTWNLSAPTRHAMAAVLTVLGILLMVGAIRLFARTGTNIEPWKPTTALVRTGIFKWTRNPMYLSMTVLYLALAVGINSVLAVVLLVPVLLVMRYVVIAREERYLERKFGAEYRHFKAEVRRWI